MNVRLIKIAVTVILSVTFCFVTTFKMIFYKAIGMTQSVASIMFQYAVSILFAVSFILYFTALVKLIKPERTKKAVSESRFLIKLLINSFLGIFFLGIPISFIVSAATTLLSNKINSELIAKNFIIFLVFGCVFGNVMWFSNKCLEKIKSKFGDKMT